MKLFHVRYFENKLWIDLKKATLNNTHIWSVFISLFKENNTVLGLVTNLLWGCKIFSENFLFKWLVIWPSFVLELKSLPEIFKKIVLYNLWKAFDNAIIILFLIVGAPSFINGKRMVGEGWDQIFLIKRVGVINSLMTILTYSTTIN